MSFCQKRMKEEKGQFLTDICLLPENHLLRCSCFSLFLLSVVYAPLSSVNHECHSLDSPLLFDDPCVEWRSCMTATRITETRITMTGLVGEMRWRKREGLDSDTSLLGVICWLSFSSSDTSRRFMIRVLPLFCIHTLLMSCLFPSSSLL